MVLASTNTIQPRLLCLQEDKENARNIKFLVYMYEQMSGIKINFKKSEVLMVSNDDKKKL